MTVTAVRTAYVVVFYFNSRFFYFAGRMRSVYGALPRRPSMSSVCTAVTVLFPTGNVPRTTEANLFEFVSSFLFDKPKRRYENKKKSTRRILRITRRIF